MAKEHEKHKEEKGKKLGKREAKHMGHEGHKFGKHAGKMKHMAKGGY